MVRRIRDIVMFVAMAIAALSGSRAMAQEYLYPFPNAAEKDAKISMEWGVGVGGLYTGINHISSPDVTLRSHLGFVGHLDMGVVFGEYFAVESEIAIQKVRLDAQHRGELFDVRSTTVVMPVMASLRLFDGVLRVNAGVSLGLLSNSGYLDGYDYLMLGAITPTWNFTAGIGAYIAHRVLVELRLTQAMQDNINQVGGVKHHAGTDFTMRTHQVSLGATILF